MSIKGHSGTKLEVGHTNDLKSTKTECGYYTKHQTILWPVFLLQRPNVGSVERLLTLVEKDKHVSGHRQLSRSYSFQRRR
eukprot:254822-Amphidinium_carterae.1